MSSRKEGAWRLCQIVKIWGKEEADTVYVEFVAHFKACFHGGTDSLAPGVERGFRIPQE
jgi:hypothetical protein